MLGTALEPHSIFVALVPSLVAIVICISKRHELRGNWLVLWLAFALSFVQGRPEIQEFFVLRESASGSLVAHALPFFAILYLIFGRFDLPSVRVAWAGTYLCLMVTDLAFNYFQWRIGPFDLPFLLTGIGGAGWMDGLVVLPVGAALITVYARRHLLNGGTFVSMLGRKWYLRGNSKHFS